MRLKKALHQLYNGRSETTDRFHYAVLVFDVLAVVYIVLSSFFERDSWMLAADLAFGVLMLADFLARLIISDDSIKFIKDPLNITDAVATFSFLSPLFGINLSFLRVLRLLHLLRASRIRTVLLEDSTYFKRNEDIIKSSVFLFIFIFVMTELVLLTQHGINPEVNNFLDAIYFTISTLTTTGFGDITLQGTVGRVLSVFIMIFGVSLFLRLIQTIFRPAKVRFLCEACGLYLHEADAVCCKHCGKVLPIPSDGTPR